MSVAFTIAHELGHLLNAPHDGEQNTCNEFNGQVHIMTPTFSIKYKTWTWSSCSRRFITEFIDSSDAMCLLDKPQPRSRAVSGKEAGARTTKHQEYRLPLKLPGEMFDRRQQCQLVYGKNSTDCLLVVSQITGFCSHTHIVLKEHTNILNLFIKNNNIFFLWSKDNDEWNITEFKKMKKNRM